MPCTAFPTPWTRAGRRGSDRPPPASGTPGSASTAYFSDACTRPCEREGARPAKRDRARRSPRAGDFICGADACATRGALLAQEPVAFRTVVTTGASALKVPMPQQHRPGYAVMTAVAVPAVRSPRATAARGPSAGWFVAKASGTAGYAASLPRWNREMGCLQRMQTGAIKGLPSPSGWTAATPSVTAVPDSPGEQRQGTRAACAAT